MRIAAAFFSFVLACGSIAGATPVSAGARLHALLARDWEARKDQSPELAAFLGDSRYQDRWDDLSLAGIAKRHDYDLSVLAELRTIPLAQLSAADKLNHELFRRDYETSLAEYRFRRWLAPVAASGGLQSAADIAELLPFTTLKNYEDWLARMRAFESRADQTTILMRAGITAHVLPPHILMERVPAQLDRAIVDDPTASAFYKPFLHVPGAIGAADRTRLQTTARELITQHINPRYQAFRIFFVDTYLPACQQNIAASSQPDGTAWYAALVHRHTTTNMTPREIHDLGLREVKRIRAAMEALVVQIGYHGTLHEFFTYLREDPKFHYSDPQELLTAYRALAKRVDPNLVKVFKKLPREPYGVLPIPGSVAPDTTTAYYQPGATDGTRAGTYYVNLYKPESRPIWEMVPLTLHESVPGHHLQIAYAHELGAIPDFRRASLAYTAYTEGWGLYAESLGNDMGMYDDPYDKFGALTYEMWRAVRLVVDTGMHAFGMSRQEAIDYFLDNAPKTKLDVTNEIDRYIGGPGQALAYKIGQLTILRLRKKAQDELGSRYDIRDFHDVVLAQGAVPLDILERNVNTYITTVKAQRRAAPGATKRVR